VLPEILRHSVPIKGTPPPAEASLSASSRWALPPGGAEAAGLHPDALNPLRSYVSLPQATFGPKRYAHPHSWPFPNLKFVVQSSSLSSGIPGARVCAELINFVADCPCFMLATWIHAQAVLQLRSCEC
jgi:hypothetical protein